MRNWLAVLKSSLGRFDHDAKWMHGSLGREGVGAVLTKIAARIKSEYILELGALDWVPEDNGERVVRRSRNSSDHRDEFTKRSS